VTAYLVFSAIPKYNTPIWETVVDFPTDVRVPSIAVLTFQPGSNLTSTTSAVSFRPAEDGSPAFSAAYVAPEGIRLFNDTDIDIYSTQEFSGFGDLPPLLAEVANLSMAIPELGSPLQKSFQVGALLQCTYTHLHPLIILLTAADNSSNNPEAIITAMPPLIMIAAYDSRLTIEQVLACNLVQLATPSAFALNVFMMETRQILDSQSKMTPPGDYDPICNPVYKDLLPHADPPFTVFDLTIMSSTPTTSNFTGLCGIGAEENTLCSTSASFSWNSQFVTTQKSLPGRSRQDIWIDLVR
jgi:hypothetical protein